MSPVIKETCSTKVGAGFTAISCLLVIHVFCTENVSTLVHT